MNKLPMLLSTRSTSPKNAATLAALLALAVTPACSSAPQSEGSGGNDAAGSTTSTTGTAGSTTGGTGGSTSSGATGGASSSGGSGGSSASSSGAGGGSGGAPATPMPPWDQGSGLDADGFTVIPPDPAGATLYISSIHGDDANGGMSMSSPVKTIHRANVLIAAQAHPNPSILRVMFERGGTYPETSSGGGAGSGPFSLSLYFASTTQAPFVLGAYGTGARPVLQAVAGQVAINGPAQAAHLWIVDLAVENAQSSSNSGNSIGIYLNGKSYDDLLFEDLYVSGFYQDVAIQPSNLTSTGPASPFTNVRFRRNVIVDSFAEADDSNPCDRSQGIYGAGVPEGLLEDNFFDNNGGGVAASSSMSHSVYWQGSNFNATFRGNFVSNAPDSIQLRGGGTANDNLFYDNAISLTLECNNYVTGGEDMPAPSSQCDGKVYNNVFLDGHDLGPSSNGCNGGSANRTQGLDISNNYATGTATGPASATVASNVWAHGKSFAFLDPSTSTPDYFLGFAVQVQKPTASVTMTGNVVYDWAGGVDFSQLSGATVTLTSNAVQTTTATSVPGSENILNASGHVDGSGNGYDSPSAKPFVYGGTGYNFAGWQSKDGSDSASHFGPPSYPSPEDPNAELDDYYAFISGGPATGGAAKFIARARQQAKGNWDPKYTAYAAAAWLRAKYGVTPMP